MAFSELIGYVAAILTTAAFIPQAWLAWRSRRLDGVSLGMYSTFTLGIMSWLAYGWLIGSWPIILANTVTLPLAVYILSMKIRFG